MLADTAVFQLVKIPSEMGVASRFNLLSLKLFTLLTLLTLFTLFTLLRLLTLPTLLSPITLFTLHTAFFSGKNEKIGHLTCVTDLTNSRSALS